MSATIVPVPASTWLLGTGLSGLIGDVICFFQTLILFYILLFDFSNHIQ
jgi:hypothetical protein